MKYPDYGKACQLWRSAAAEAWQGYVCHPFVEQLGQGTLPRAAFLHYLRQDYVFLIHFARAWSLAVAKAETLEEMQAASATVYTLLHSEMALHMGICAAAGISREELEATPERRENQAYTRYVLEAGYSGDLLDLLAALAPCVLGYGEIGHRLAREYGAGPYREWIDTYASEEFQEACRKAGALFDAALTRRLGEHWEHLPRWQQLCRHFRNATLLEQGFWEMGLTPEA